MLELRDRTRKNWQALITYTDLHKTNTKWLMHSWSTLGTKTSHGRPWTHKTHHGPDSEEATTFPHIVYCAPLHGTLIQMTFCPGMGVPKSLRLELLQLCKTITSCADLWLGWGLKQSCSPCRELSNDVLHATWTQGNWVDSWLSVVESQISSLTLGLSFDYHLCFRHTNGSCKPI
jgi:hypothetical protein